MQEQWEQPLRWENGLIDGLNVQVVAVSVWIEVHQMEREIFISRRNGNGKVLVVLMEKDGEDTET